MKKSLIRLSSIIASGLLVASAFAADPTTAPSVASAPTTQSVPAKTATGKGTAAKVDMQAAQAFITKTRSAGMKLQGLESKSSDWSDSAKREKISTDIQPSLAEMIPAIDDMADKGKTAEVELVGGDEFVTMAALFGDADMQKHIADMATKTGESGRWGKVALAASKFYLANGEVTAQGKALDELENLFSTDPATKMLVTRADLSIYESKPSQEIADRVETYVTTKLKSKAIAQVKASQKAELTRAALVNKPMVLSGVLRDGTKFSSADMKGKVILVDFWASWCGPCKAELPRVKKAYADFHSQGFEVIGVSCDYTLDALNKYLEQNPEMAWPQMFDAKTPGWHALAKQDGITGIPTMFLIDKNGVCRSVTAREDFEKEIPKLLAENAAK